VGVKGVSFMEQSILTSVSGRRETGDESYTRVCAAGEPQGRTVGQAAPRTLL
jgi:hypothetical protein